MDNEGMQVELKAINRRLVANGGDGVFIIVKAAGLKGSPDALVEDVTHAVKIANQALIRDGEELVNGADVIATSKGPVVNLDWVGTDEQNEEWFATLAGELTKRGRVGTLTPAPQANYPAAVSRITQPWLTAQMAFTLSDPGTYGYPPMTWLVDSEVTDRIAEHAAQWARIDRATCYLSEATLQFTVSDPNPAAAFTSAIERAGFAELSYLTRPPSAARP